MAQNPTEKPGAQQDGVSIHRWILNRYANFFREVRREHLIGIEQQNPVVSDWERVHGPLPLLRPSALIMKLDDLGSVGSRDLDCFVRALRIDDEDFANICESLQASRQILRLVAHRE